MRLFSICKSRNKMAEAAAVRRAKTGRGLSGKGGDGDGGEGSVNMTLNPAMLLRAKASAGGGDGDADLLSMELLDSIVDSPNAVQVRCEGGGRAVHRSLARPAPTHPLASSGRRSRAPCPASSAPSRRSARKMRC